MSEFITNLPKAELHIHIEGSLEPEMMFDLAARNELVMPFEDADEVREAYKFGDLQSFLDIYYQGASVLQTPQDFYDLMTAYLDRAAADGVRRAEISFDPQTHTQRGLPFGIFMEGLREAMADGQRRSGISSDLILCFLRHLSGEEAVETLRQAEGHLEGVIAVGLDSSELGRPPELFVDAFDAARALGLRTVAHAGEEGPPEYVVGALDVLGAERIDHGVRSLEDDSLMERLRMDQVPLTVCPLSNVELRVVRHISEHPLRDMIQAGLNVSVNSDDPAYFGGYIVSNYLALAETEHFNESVMADLAANSINSSFLDQEEKDSLLAEIDQVRVINAN